MPSIINSDNGVVSGTSGLKTTGGNDGILSIQNNGTTNVTVTAAGGVGVGTSSPDSLSNFRFVDVGSSGTNQGVIQANNGTVKAAIYVNGTDGIVATRTNHNLNFQTNATTQATITPAGLFQFNSGYGSVATAYGCRAWVNFNGTTNVGGFCTVRASGNVSSVADNGTGDYTVNFTTAMPDADYAATGASSFIGTTNYVGPVAFNNNNSTGASVAPTTTALRTVIRNSSATAADPQYLYVAIFR
jgi:hypothetical protein